MVGSSLTYADIVLFSHLDAILTIDEEALQVFPLLNALYERIKSREKISTYLKNRPESGL
jgi:glutathione S-transferase